MSRVVLDKAGRVIARKIDALVGRMIPLRPVLEAMSARPYELHLEQDLGEVWRNRVLQGVRDSFGTDALNATCRTCDMYRDLELYRTGEGRRRASISRRRGGGERIRREDASQGAFAGG